jgi:hypothetical protein
MGRRVNYEARLLEAPRSHNITTAIHNFTTAHPTRSHTTQPNTWALHLLLSSHRRRRGRCRCGALSATASSLDPRALPGHPATYHVAPARATAASRSRSRASWRRSRILLPRPPPLASSGGTRRPGSRYSSSFSLRYDASPCACSLWILPSFCWCWGVGSGWSSSKRWFDASSDLFLRYERGEFPAADLNNKF